MIFTPTPENPENTPDHLKAALTAAIAKVVHESYPTDKYRSRKLDFETLTQLLITMDGGSHRKGAAVRRTGCVRVRIRPAPQAL